jgi:hypothetical protein
MQEVSRKDIERAFGVLQSRFPIVWGPPCFRDKKPIKIILFASVILHNIIIEYKRDANLSFEFVMLAAV